MTLRQLDQYGVSIYNKFFDIYLRSIFMITYSQAETTYLLIDKVAKPLTNAVRTYIAHM